MKSFLKVCIGIAFIAIGFGIGILILAAATGVSVKDVPTYSVNESYDHIEKIDMQIDYGKVNVIEGETFSIDAENLLENSLDSHVTEGTWYIEQDQGHYIDIFGIRCSLSQLGRWSEDLTPTITITIPNGFVADDFILKVGAGDVTVEEVNTVEGDFTVEAGRLTIDQLFVSGSSSYNVGAGEMVLKDTTVNNITLECGVGHIVIEGTLTGDNDISCGIGGVELNLTGDDSDYSYDISAGISNVVIDGRSYHGDDRIINKETDNYLRLDCGIGNITVDFN